MDLDQKKGKVEMSMQLGKWMNIMEKENGQEKESKERNIVNWESGEIEDDNWYSKNINGGANIFMIYELKFSYYEDNSENNDEIIIAVYSSYKKAEIGKKKFSQQPRFKGKEEFLEINEYKINEAEWNEGFWRATKSYFIIKLFNNYMIEKEEEYNPENHDIEVKYGENIKVYNGKMDYYYDHEKFLCLKNTENGQMYCLDKQQRKILYKINKYEDMLKFLNQKYEIENFGWKNIFREWGG